MARSTFSRKVPAHRQADAVAQLHGEVAVRLGKQLGHAIDPHHRRSMNPDELGGVQLLLERRQRLAQQILGRPHVQLDVVVGGLNPIDIRPVDDDDPVAARYGHAGRRPRGSPELLQQGRQPPIALARGEVRLRALERGAEALLAERLQQVVDRVEVERPQRVAVERGHEDHRRAASPAGRASSTAKPSSSGICTSRNTRSGASVAIASTAAAPSPHSPTTAHRRIRRQIAPDAPARDGLVVHDQHAQRHAAGSVGRSGNSSDTSAPPFGPLVSSSRCSRP